MYYASIEGISDDYLEFLGYVCVAESPDFKLYRDYYGREHIVDRAKPYLMVDDPNDAQILARRTKRAEIIDVPRG